MSITKEDVIQYVENMTVLELSELVKALEEKFGVQAAMPMMAAGAGAAAPAAAPVEEQTEFNVILTGYEADRRSRSSRLSGPLRALASKRQKIL